MWNGKNIPFGKGIKISEPFEVVRALIDDENTLVAISTLGVVYVAYRFNIIIHCCIYFAIGECVNFLTGTLLPFRWLNTVFEQKGCPIQRTFCSSLMLFRHL